MYYARCLAGVCHQLLLLLHFLRMLLCAGACCPPPLSACANVVRALLHTDVLVQPAGFRQLEQPEENSILL